MDLHSISWLIPVVRKQCAENLELFLFFLHCKELIKVPGGNENQGLLSIHEGKSRVVTSPCEFKSNVELCVLET